MRSEVSSQLVRAALGVFVASSAHAQSSASPLLKNFIGINGHSWAMTPHVDLYAPVTSLVRDYHPMSWDVTTTGDNTKFPLGATNWPNWKTEYGTWGAAGLRTNMDIQFESFDQTAWTSMAADAYKYGKAVGQYFGAGGAGAGLVSSIEIGNEPGSYSDANYVTVVKNMSQAIRDYAPTMQIVTCNVKVRASGTYDKNVDLFRTNNMLEKVDVLATHVYAELTGWPTWEPSYPEDTRLPHYLNDVQELVNWRNQYAPGKPVWVTEFGYDSTTQPNYTTGTFKDEKFVTDKQAAQYIVRSYLAFAAMGVDRAYMYYFNDSDNPSVHSSSGLTRNFVPKPSYYAVQHMQETLGEYRFASKVQETAGSLYIHAYVNGTNPNDLIWVLWSPTGSDRQMLVTLSNIPGNPLRAEQMPLADGAAPVVPLQTLANGNIQLTVGESPVYLYIAVPEPTAAMLVIPGFAALLRRRRQE